MSKQCTPSLPSSWRVSLAYYKSFWGIFFDNWVSNVILQRKFYSYKTGVALSLVNFLSVMTGYQSGGFLPGATFRYCWAGVAMGYNSIYCLEVFFFLSFFWSYFHIRLAPSVDIGRKWCPLGISPLNPLDMPLLNTVILIVSGISVTWAHHALIEGNHQETQKGLIATCLLGVLFTGLQLIEYNETSFSIADGAYGSVFFIATGFHGFHVIVGTLFLITIYIRIGKGHLRPIHHFGFEARAWYWHFVDVVWLFLYLCIYWWGSM